MKHAILTIVGLTVLLAGVANALETTTFDDVEAEVNLRLGNLPTEDLTKEQKKEKKSLEKVLKTFAKESTSSKKDAKLIDKIVKTLAKQYPEDQGMLDMLNGSLDSFHDEFYAGKADVDFGYDYLTDENRKKKSADKSREKVEGLDATYGEAIELKDKTRYLKKVETGLTKYGKATRKALKKEAGLTNHEMAFLATVEGGYQGAASCMVCHEEAATDMLSAGHWTWDALSPNLVDDDGELHGKNDVINNFCIAVPSNEARCTECHPGYGYADATFDFADASQLDCLVCHDTTGTYDKNPTDAGRPKGDVDLRNVAMNVGAPTRQNCGACHFYAGGGDNVKKGDLGSSLTDPTKAMDVHMGSDGQNFSCQECHETVAHKIPGNQIQDSGRVDCQDCHDTADLSAANHTSSHVAMLACQTCHIPAFSRQLPTKVHWDWSTAGDKERVPVNDANGMPDYSWKKGDFVWAKDVAPSLKWYNGTWKKTIIGLNDVWSGTGVFVLSEPQGSNGDGKVYPFKEMTGFQPYDTVNNTVLVPKLFGATGYWSTTDWEQSLQLGAAAAGQTYNAGNFDFLETVSYLSINHEVAPKEQAIGSGGCADCHNDNNAGFPWAELGITKPF